MKIKPLFAAVLLVFLALFASCAVDFLFVHDLILEMPGRPECWRGAVELVYAVRWEDESGGERLAFAREGEALAIRLRRGVGQAVFAQPIRPGFSLRPAGALYPFDLEASGNRLPSPSPDRLKASFESGYAAAVACAIEEAGYDPWVFPIEKLASIQSARNLDPWCLPPWKAARSLLAGEFRVSAFPSPKTNFPLPDDTSWWPESALCRVAEEGENSAAYLPEGIHLFFAEGEKLVVEVARSYVSAQRTSLSKENGQ